MNLILKIAVGVLAVLTVIFLVFGIVYDGGSLSKTLIFVAAVLVLLLTLEVTYLLMLSVDTKPNYFLFNPKFNKNIPVQKLTFEMIDARMNKYLSSFADSEGKIWTDRVLDNPQIDIDKAYKPAVAYKLLFDIANFDNDAGWKCFVAASDATVVFICRGLAQNGDTEMANALNQLKSTKPLNMKHVRDYLVGNKKYIQRKFYRYIVDNIDLF